MPNSVSSQSDCPENGWPWKSIAFWLALCFATSHVLADLVEHWITYPWSRYSLTFVLLLVLAIRNAGHAAPTRRVGMSLIVLAMIGVLGSVLASIPFAARPCIAVALIGGLLFRGTAPWRTALLALWIIPIPSIVMRALDGVPIGIDLFEIAALATAPLGVYVDVQGGFLHVADAKFAVAAHQGGGVVLVHLTGLAWYAAVNRAASWPTTLKWLAGATFLALPVQILASMLTLVLLQSEVFADAGLRLGELARWLLPTLLLVVYAKHQAVRLDRS